MNKNIFSTTSYEQKVIARGTHGNCKASDTVSFFINIPLHDRISDAKLLHLGKNGPFNNQCASVDTNEPHPGDGGCLVEDTWCYDPSNSKVINHTLWFQVDAPNNGVISLKTSGFDTRVALYEAANEADLISGNISKYQLIAANDNTSASEVEASLINIKVETGKNYWLQVDGYKGMTGNFYLNLFNNDFEVYPNPSTGIFNFVLARNEISNGTVEILSAQGSLVFKSQIANSPESVYYKVDLRHLSSGYYTALITLEGTRFIKKIVLIK
jgi:hypothetical protein